MFVTVTLNPAIDKIQIINQFISGKAQHVFDTETSVGGKGLDTSVALHQLGTDTLAFGFFAGETGHELLELIESNRKMHLTAPLTEDRTGNPRWKS